MSLARRRSNRGFAGVDRGLARTTVILCLCVFAFAGRTLAQGIPAPDLSLNALTQAVQVLNLSAEEAKRLYPVRLRGVVTCAEGRAQLWFVQDETAGVYAYVVGTSEPIQVGQLVEVTGVSGAGLFAPIVHWATVKVVGKAPLPAPKKIAIEQLASGREDSQWVEVEGIIHQSVEDWGHLVLDLVEGASRLKVRLLQYPKESKDGWVDARVKIQGVAGTAYNNTRQLTGFHLLVPNLAQITLVRPPAEDPFAAPVRLGRSLLSYSPQRASGHRVHLRGVVTLQWLGKTLFIRDGSGGVQIQTEQETRVAAGDVVEVVGFPAASGYTPILTDAIFRKAEAAAPPEPRAATADRVLSGEFDKELVQLEAVLLANADINPEHQKLVLQAGKAVFNALLDHSDQKREVSSLANGSRLQLTGVCSVEMDAVGKPKGFQFWLRSPQDIVVLELPARLKVARMLWVLGGLAASIGLSLIWVVMLRKRVAQQTKLIRRREAALEDRCRDLFENANDIIYTLDLSGRVTSLNKAGEVVLGYTRDEALRLTMTELLAPEHRAMAQQGQDWTKTGGSRASFEVEVVTKEGRRLALEVNTRPNYHEGLLAGVRGIARDITARKRAESALRQSEQKLREAWEEREKLGRNLHDGIIQSIYAVGLNLEDCKRLVTQNPAEAGQRLARVLADLNTVIREVRNFILGLESDTLKGREFKTALKSLVLTLGDAHSPHFNLDVDASAAESLTPTQATQLLHIAREAISNSVRHARAGKTVLSLQRHNGAIRFEVQDDGVGFDTKSLPNQGHGLRNLTARAQEMGARFTVISQIGQGTRIVLDIPHKNDHDSCL